MLIAYDFDDVIFDLEELLQRKFIEHYNFDVNKNNGNMYYINIPGVSDDEIASFIHKTIRECQRTGIPIENSIGTLKKIYKEFNIPVWVITYRQEDVKDITENWLRTYIPEIPFKVFYTSHGRKDVVLKENNIQYFVDDRVDHVQDASKVCRAAFIYTKPWNKDYEVKNNIYRINNFDEIYDFVRNLHS